MALRRLEKAAQTVIACLYRGHRYRLTKAKRHARLVSHWGFFYFYVYHTTYKGQQALLIQTWCENTCTTKSSPRPLECVPKNKKGQARKLLLTCV
jgi:hypothetical protein